MLTVLGDMFSSVGMGQQAVEAYTKAGKISEAIDTCVDLNQWHQAVDLATKYNQPNQASKEVDHTVIHMRSLSNEHFSFADFVPFGQVRTASP